MDTKYRNTNSFSPHERESTRRKPEIRWTKEFNTVIGNKILFARGNVWNRYNKLNNSCCCGFETARDLKRGGKKKKNRWNQKEIQRSEVEPFLKRGGGCNQCLSTGIKAGWSLAGWEGDCRRRGTLADRLLLRPRELSCGILPFYLPFILFAQVYSPSAMPANRASWI